jgi:2-polyprenyl-3-methyl-5-hydroxy-6-metoxy-1,4-benzoquinol methylase
MDTDNSASLILKNVNPGTKVLEFGCGNGYMTEYLNCTLACNVSIVELNYDDGKQASQYADQSLIGESGNIEQYDWLSTWKDQKFDHIIFADVLEHLYDPYKVLKESVALLKDDGTILISIPNISHNSVIIDLINNNFEYRELGLLDNTHIRFFTRRTLEKMVKNAGLKVSKKMDSHCAVEHTELKNNFGHVSPFVEIALRKRTDGDIYQFIWELKL